MITWTQQQDGSWSGYSGRILVAMILQRVDGGKWHWHMSGVHWKWVSVAEGEVATIPRAKRACERAWTRWLDKAGLVPAPAP